MNIRRAGRKWGPITAKPHRKTSKNRNTASVLTEILKPQLQVLKLTQTTFEVHHLITNMAYVSKTDRNVDHCFHIIMAILADLL